MLLFDLTSEVIVNSLLLVFLAFSAFMFSEGMQDTGLIPPKGYLQIQNGIPEEGVKLIERFLPSNPVIVEAGAYDGKESLMLSRHFPSGQVYCFEPVKSLYKKVVLNTGRVKNIKSYNCALGAFIGESQIYLSNISGETSMSSSLYQPKEHLDYCSFVQFSGVEKIKVTTLDDWAKKNKINRVDVLWLDMQGTELDALKSSPSTLKNVSAIIIELEFVEAYAGQPLYKEVKTWLESQGFQLIAGNFSFPKEPSQWFGDGVFVRKTLLKNTEFED